MPLKKGLKGRLHEFDNFLKERFEYDEDEKRVDLGYNRSYLLKTINAQIRKGTLPAALEAEFITRLTTSNRLGGEPDNVKHAASVLYDDEPAEIKISSIIRKAFGSDLILNRTSEGGYFQLGDRASLPSHAERLTPAFRKWIDELPLVSDQGDGTRSFCRVVLELLVQPGSLVLIDEPEAFLHPPQIRQLARVIATQTSPDTQIVTATHSDDFIRGLLDASIDRVTVARMERREDINPTTILEPSHIQELWHDPLLRTSGLLSALFHEVAIICEGETDARFYQALMDATQPEHRDPDYRFYHCGGKDRIPGIAKALMAVRVPIVAVVDIDVLADANMFKALIGIMGGDFSIVERPLKLIHKAMAERKFRITGAFFASQLAAMVEKTKSLPSVPSDTIAEVRNLLRESSPWVRVKEDGERGFVDATTVSAFREVAAVARSAGILINTEGELEGFCRDISRATKSAWLNKVLTRDLAHDAELAVARSFAGQLRSAIDGAMSK